MTTHLDKLTAEFREHWDRILEIQGELYDREVAARRHARECGRALREIEAVTQPLLRTTPPRLEAVPTIPKERTR